MSILRENEIQKCCFLSSSFGNAKKILVEKKINRILLRKKEKDRLIIKAAVQGNSRPEYQTSIELTCDLRTVTIRAKVESCVCECEAYRTYKGFCKHLAAVMLLVNKKFDDNTVRDILENCAVGYQLSYQRSELYGKNSLKSDLTDRGRSMDEFFQTGSEFRAAIGGKNGADREMAISGAEKGEGKGIEGRGSDRETVMGKEMTGGRRQLEDFVSTDRDRGFMYNAASNTLELAKGEGKRNWLSYSDAQEAQYEWSARKPYRQKSSEELLEIMAEVEWRQRNEYCRDITRGRVKLEPVMDFDYDRRSLRLQFKIGDKRMYIVKNVNDFFDNVKNQTFCRYGKQLEFSHQQSAFTKESLELIALLLESASRGPRNPLVYEDNRYLTLTPVMADAFLQRMEGSVIWLSGDLSGNLRQEKIKVVREDPTLQVTISGKDEGKKAVLDFQEVLWFKGAEHLYVFKGDQLYVCSEDYHKAVGGILRMSRPKKQVRFRYRYYNYSEEYPRQFELVQSDYGYFCATLLPVLHKYMKVVCKDIDFDDYHMQEGRYEAYFSIQEGDILCHAKAIYGEKEHNLLTVAELNESYRDIRLEHELRLLLKGYFPEISADGKAFRLPKDDEKIAELIEYGLGEIRELADVFLSEEFKRIRIAPKLHITAGLSVKGNLLKVSWNVEEMESEEIAKILAAYEKKKKYFRLKSGELLNLKDSGIDVLGKIYENLKPEKQAMLAGEAEVPLYRALYLNNLAEENREQLILKKNEKFIQFMEQFEEARKRKYPLPDKLTAKLREYQLEGFQWLSSLAAFGFGGILADDMGLGKTLQMIAYLCSIQGKTHLVICPASLVYNWEAEFARFAGHLSVCLVVGDAKQRAQLIDDYRKYDVLVTSYDLLKRDVEYYAGKQFGCQVIDEAQYIKNHLTQASKAVRVIESEVRFALTGTPIENRISELWSIFDYIMPEYLYSYRQFRERFEANIMNQVKDDSIEMLHKMIRPFVLRRLKKDVLRELPDKVEKVVYTRFGEEQEQLYRAVEKNILMNIGKKSEKEWQENKLQILAELTRLRQICCAPELLYENYEGGSAKEEACMELVESAVDSGHRILLFSQFTTMLDILAQRLKKKKLRTFMLTGSTSKVARRNLVERFQAGEAEVFLISLKAGGTGLNLTGADMVIHYDPWWNVAAQNQATDRTHRIGQKNKVTVVKLIARDSIEERILNLQNQKRELADKILSGENVSMASLTKEELLALFSN